MVSRNISVVVSRQGVPSTTKMSMKRSSPVSEYYGPKLSYMASSLSSPSSIVEMSSNCSSVSIEGLLMYVATRGLYKMKPPMIIVPKSIKDRVESLFKVHRKERSLI